MEQIIEARQQFPENQHLKGSGLGFVEPAIKGGQPKIESVITYSEHSLCEGKYSSYF